MIAWCIFLYTDFFLLILGFTWLKSVGCGGSRFLLDCKMFNFDHIIIRSRLIFDLYTLIWENCVSLRLDWGKDVGLLTCIVDTSCVAFI